MADDRFADGLSRELSDVGVELDRIGDLADGVARALSRAFRGAAVDGRSLNSVLGDIARSFSDIALKAAFKPAPGEGTAITASFTFDVPVRFDIDRLDIELTSFDAAEAPSIPLIEVRE